MAEGAGRVKASELRALHPPDRHADRPAMGWSLFAMGSAMLRQ